MDFEVDFGSIWGGFGHQKSKKGEKNEDEILNRILKPIWLKFGPPRAKKTLPPTGYAKAYLGSFWSSDMSKRRANHSLKL